MCAAVLQAVAYLAPPPKKKNGASVSSQKASNRVVAVYANSFFLLEIVILNRSCTCMATAKY